METDTSDSNTMTGCQLCNELTTVNEYIWSIYINSEEQLFIIKYLCIECGKQFEIKTKQLQRQLIGHIHSKYIDWENSKRLELQLNRRQQKLPNV